MSSFFFDTSALVKIYHKEVGTEIVEEIYENPDNKIFISQLSQVEFLSALCKKIRTDEITTDAFTMAYDKFATDLENRFQVIVFFSELLIEAENLICQFGQSKELRTLDSIQLATYYETMDKECFFVCADKKLYKLLKDIGIRVYPFW